MRIEAMVNMPRDLGCNSRLLNLDDLQAKARRGQPAHVLCRACRPGLRPGESSL